MIGYLTLGTNNIAKAREFYDALLPLMGGKRVSDDGDRLSLWTTKRGAPLLGLIRPHDGKEATIGNGTMTALLVDDRETMVKMYEKALELGGTDEGAPGPRGPQGMEFAYCRDPEGHKLAFYCMG